MVSFVIPAWNEEALLGSTLEAIFTAAQPTAPRREELPSRISMR